LANRTTPYQIAIYLNLWSIDDTIFEWLFDFVAHRTVEAVGLGDSNGNAQTALVAIELSQARLPSAGRRVDSGELP
jgi:hypothetical protein